MSEMPDKQETRELSISASNQFLLFADQIAKSQYLRNPPNDGKARNMKTYFKKNAQDENMRVIEITTREGFRRGILKKQKQGKKKEEHFNVFELNMTTGDIKLSTRVFAIDNFGTSQDTTKKQESIATTPEEKELMLTRLGEILGQTQDENTTNNVKQKNEQMHQIREQLKTVQHTEEQEREEEHPDGIVDNAMWA